MKILIISQGDIKKDGRLIEIFRVMEHLGEVFLICSSSEKISENDHVFFYNTKNKAFNPLFILFCLKKASMMGPFDLIVSDNRNCILPGLICKRFTRCRLSLYDARELYIYKEVSTIISRFGCIIEYLFVPKFDIITCANSYRSKLMFKLYKLKRRPIPFENIRQLEYSDLSKVDCEKRFGYLFSASKHYTNIVTTSGEALIRRADELVKAVACLGENFRLFLIGVEDPIGHYKIQKICDQHNWHNILRYKWLSKSELKYIISNCDIGIVNYSYQNTNNKYCASGKLFEFIYEGIPVVTTSNPPLRKICDDYKIGFVDDSFSDGIKRVIFENSILKQNIRLYINNNKVSDNTKNVSNKILSIIKSFDNA